MTPGARLAASIEVLDQVLSGQPAERALTNWARGARYAGSGDRAAVRDFVFGALRCRRSAAWVGGAETARGIIIGLCRLQNLDLDALFSGDGHAPSALTEEERVSQQLSDAPEAVAWDVPDWLIPEYKRSLGDCASRVADAMRHRAPVFLRVNLRKSNVQSVTDILAGDNIHVEPHVLAPTALKVTENPRRVSQSRAYRDGLVELQDAASQAVIAELPRANRVLDYCAGGGGKSLALAALGMQVWAHDAAPRRMADLGARAARAGVDIKQISPGRAGDQAPFDLVLCDVPCSGSGSWRRNPDGKWKLTQSKLDSVIDVQAKILDEASELVATNGVLAYVTCSMFDRENAGQIDRFMQRNDMWCVDQSRVFLPTDGGDGFFVSILRRR